MPQIKPVNQNYIFAEKISHKCLLYCFAMPKIAAPKEQEFASY